MNNEIIKYDDRGRVIYYSDNRGYECWDSYDENGNKVICFSEKYGKSRYWIIFAPGSVPLYTIDSITGEEWWRGNGKLRKLDYFR